MENILEKVSDIQKKVSDVVDMTKEITNKVSAIHVPKVELPKANLTVIKEHKKAIITGAIISGVVIGALGTFWWFYNKKIDDFEEDIEDDGFYDYSF